MENQCFNTLQEGLTTKTLYFYATSFNNYLSLFLPRLEIAQSAEGSSQIPSPGKGESQDNANNFVFVITGLELVREGQVTAEHCGIIVAVYLHVVVRNCNSQVQGQPGQTCPGAQRPYTRCIGLGQVLSKTGPQG